MFFWNLSEPDPMPKGKMLKQKRPYGAMNVVGGLDSQASLICQKPEQASNFVKTLKPFNLPSAVSTTASELFSLLMHSLTFLGST